MLYPLHGTVVHHYTELYYMKTAHPAVNAAWRAIVAPYQRPDL